jgi:ArsR family transcriptional regulator, arsenate/arsenite/antimonite-responsive transcriptional repressor
MARSIGISSSLQIRQGLRWPESTPDDQTVRVFQVLGNPIRLRILWLLAHREEFGVEIDPCCDGEVVCVCRIKALFDISAPDLSHHLRVLREAGLVEAQRAGIWTHYSLRSESLATALEVISELHGNNHMKARLAGPMAASDADRDTDADMSAARWKLLGP